MSRMKQLWLDRLNEQSEEPILPPSDNENSQEPSPETTDETNH